MSNSTTAAKNATTPWAMAYPAHQVEVGAYWLDPDTGDWYQVVEVGSHWADGASSGYYVQLADADAPETDYYDWVSVVTD